LGTAINRVPPLCFHYGVVVWALKKFPSIWLRGYQLVQYILLVLLN